MVFHFYNICLDSFYISSLFSDGIIISSTYHKFSAGKGFDFTILSVILYAINSPVASTALLKSDCHLPKKFVLFASLKAL